MTEVPRPPLPPFQCRLGQNQSAWPRMRGHAIHSGFHLHIRTTACGETVEFLQGREAIVELLIRKWSKELDYRLIKELWSYDLNRIAKRFAYEWYDDSGSGSVLMAMRTGSLI